ncbi:MAG: glutaredoxin family protein [Acidobacteriota bacterium]
MRHVLLSIVLLLLASASAATIPTDAEVLVLTDGTRLEIDGDVVVDGRKITFTDAQGRLAMLRASEVDLDATTRANQPPVESSPATESTETAETDAARPVMVLTNDDVQTYYDDEIDGPAAAPRVVVYSTSWCPTCKKTKKLLDEWQVPFIEHDIEKDPLARDERDNRDPNCGVPVIDVGGQLMCGLQPKRLAEMLASIGIEPVINR